MEVLINQKKSLANTPCCYSSTSSSNLTRKVREMPLDLILSEGKIPTCTS
jgi:hypothetical protein